MRPAPYPDQERQHAVTCRKLIIGIATIVIIAALYALVKSYSDSSASELSSRSQPESSELWLTTAWFTTFIIVSYMVVLLMCTTSACVEAAVVLQELRRNTKSDASLAIPVAPIARRRCPDAGQDSDCLDIDWVPPVGCGATDYHLQWREQPEQEPTEWASSVASEKIGVPCCTKGSLRTHTPYQFRVRAFSAVSERWGPWSPPSKPETVRPGKVLPSLLSLAATSMRRAHAHAPSHPPTTTQVPRSTA